MNSALALLTEKGVHNTPMSAIAKRAGTGMGTIYNYFTTKEILINHIYVSIKEKEKSVLPPFELNASIKTQFEHYLSAITTFFVENPAYFKFMEQLQASPIITEESRLLGVESVQPVVDLLEEGKRNAIIKNMETDDLVMFIGGAILSYLRWHTETNESDSLNNLQQLVWDAIKN